MKDNTLLIGGAVVLGLALLSKTSSATGVTGSGNLGYSIGTGAGSAVSGAIAGVATSTITTPFSIGESAGAWLYQHTLQPSILAIKSWGDPNRFWS